MGPPGGQRPPLRQSISVSAGAACGRPQSPLCAKKNHVPLPRHSEAVRPKNP